MFNKFPYTDLHNLNLDWFLEQFKNLVTEFKKLKIDFKNLEDNIPSGDFVPMEVRQAIFNILDNNAFANDDRYVSDLAVIEAWATEPPALLIGISAVYTQNGTVYDNDTLDSLRSDLIVTALYDNGTTQTVTSYTLTGTLTEGTSVITVSYGGMTTTFNVTVSAELYVTNGLIHRWDAIDNTNNGHNSNATAWEDLIGDNHLTLNSTEYATWGDDYLSLSGNAAQFLDCVGGQIDNTLCTVEVVLSPSSNGTQVVMYVGKPNRSVLLFSDGTFNMNGVSNASYPTGLNDFSDIHSLVALYDVSAATGTYYLNNVEKTQGSTAHSMVASWTDRMRIGATPGATAGYVYTGKIHAIRIYNRHLTAEELLKNYNSDLNRFSLE